jgi:hypothetical protein
MLSEAGFEVDVFIRGWGGIIPPVGAMPPGVRIVDNRLVQRLSFPNTKRVVPARLGVLAGFPLFLALVLLKAWKQRYTAVFGADPLGGFCGRLMAACSGSPLYYWSLQLFAAPTTLRERIFFAMQRCACQSATGILIQDRKRAESLLNGDEGAASRVWLIPNGPAGPPALDRSAFLESKLRIPPEMKIVLHAGMLDDRVLSFQLADSVRAWPAPYCLVLHANRTIATDAPYVRKIRELIEPRVFLSLQPVPASAVDDVIASAYIGLVTYEKGLGPNWDLMASASGKLGCYLRNGIPVICTNQTGMREMMEAYHCGVVIGDVDEVPAAIERISRDYEWFRAGATHCYQREYEFSAHFAGVLKALQRAKDSTETRHKLI